MKKIYSFIVFCVFMSLAFADLHGQDKFNSTQFTFERARVGFPTWSPDGKFIIYSYISFNDSMGKSGLWKVSLDGKEKKQICFELAEHPRWSPDGRSIVFDSDSGKSMKMIPAEGGPPVRIVSDSIQMRNGGMPCWSPDGSHIAFVEEGTLSLCIENIATKTITRIFKQDGMVPIPGCWTRDGKSVLIALMEMKTRKSTIWKIAANGKEKKQITGHHEGIYRYLDLSPDGSLLLYGAIEIKEEKRITGLWIMSVEGGKSIQLVSHPSFNDAPQWSPDGKKIAFASSRSGGGIWIMDVDVEQVKTGLRELNK